MSKWDSGVNGIVEMLYNWLFYGVIHDVCFILLKLFG